MSGNDGNGNVIWGGSQGMGGSMGDLEKLFARARAPVDVGGEPFVFLPVDARIESVESMLPVPLRIKRKAELHTEAAFIEYFSQFKGGPGTNRMYADPGGLGRDNMIAPSVLCIFDDHNSPDGDPENQPTWGDHRALYQCKFSRQWLQWTANDRKKLDQVAFAEWLEDRTADVVSPPGGELLDLCLQLRVHQKVTFGSAATLASGEMSFSYSKENDSGTIEIPAMIKLGIPVFHGGPSYEVTARFRYRLQDGGKLTLWYELVEPDKFVEDAFEAVTMAIAEETEMTIMEAKLGTL